MFDRVVDENVGPSTGATQGESEERKITSLVPSGRGYLGAVRKKENASAKDQIDDIVCREAIDMCREVPKEFFFDNEKPEVMRNPVDYETRGLARATLEKNRFASEYIYSENPKLSDFSD